MDQPQILPLNDAEVQWIQDNLAFAGQLVERYTGKRESLPSLELIGTTYAAWGAAPEDQREEPNSVINALGLVFGQHLINQAGMKWVVVSDKIGTDIAVQAEPGCILIYPTVVTAKRFERKQYDFFSWIIKPMLEDVEAMRKSAKDDGIHHTIDRNYDTMATQSADCCPVFNPSPWDDQVFEWDGKRFIRDKVYTLFYVPMNFGKVMRRLDARVKSAGAAIPDNLCLADHTSKWNMDVYLAVDREIPGAQNTTLSGKFYSKVYDGPYKDTGKWCKDFASRSAAKQLTIQKWYMWYTTCPKCAKKTGHNFVVIVAQVK